MFGIDFDRYLEPMESDVIDTCKGCGGEIYEGEEIFTSQDGDHYCTEECFLESIEWEYVQDTDMEVEPEYDTGEAVVYEGELFHDTAELLNSIAEVEVLERVGW